MPLRRFGCATCSRHGVDLTIVKTHLSWNCNRHPGLVELHITAVELSRKTITAKVLRTTLREEISNEDEEVHHNNKLIPYENEEQLEEENNEAHAFKDVEEKNL